METMTVKEVLEITIKNLEGIQVPVALLESIGVPIRQNANNLRECILAIDREEQAAAGYPEPGMEMIELPEEEP